MPRAAAHDRRRSSALKGPLRDAALLTERLLDAVLVAATRLSRRTGRSGPRRHVLVAGPGNGSIGDEAMYEAFASSNAPLLVVARTREDLLADPASFGATPLYMPGLLYGGVRAHLSDLWKLLPYIQDAESLSVIGADTMDGKYGIRPSVRRFRTATIAAALGVPACVLGFSWNEAPAPATRRALQAVPRSVRLFARDPISGARLRADGGSTVIDTADLAFLIDPAPARGPASDWFDRQARDGRRVVVVNANPRLATSFPDQSQEYVDLVRVLVAAGFACFVLPHDSRGGAESEIAYLLDLFGSGDQDDAVFVAPDVFLPPQVAWVCSRAELVVSGRMHLVILAATGGTPAVGLDYQGKFEGLYSNLGYDLRLPAGVLQGRLLTSVLDALDHSAEYARTLAQSMPAIRNLARRNFALGATRVEDQRVR